MQVKMGAHAGFCYGVKAAVDKAFAACEQGGEVWSLGSLIHNEEVMRKLRDAGLRVAETPEEVTGGVVLIRSHGVPPDTICALEARGVTIIDATCPNVARVHKLVADYSAGGDTVIIAGQKEHPEVQATAGWAKGPVIIAGTAQEAEVAPMPQRALVAAQTTLTQAAWQEITAVIKRRIPALTIASTICAATETRQQEARALCGEVDVMLVVGGKNSANTRALYETCLGICKRTYWIESAAEIPFDRMTASDIIGITAGASTPDWSLKEVATRMNDLEQNTPQEAENQPTAATTETAEAAPVAPAATTPSEEAPAEQANEPVAEAAPAAEASGDAPKEDAPVAEAVEDEAKEEAPTMNAAERSFMDEIDATLVTIRPGQTITGTVVQITDDEVCVNIGYKSDGIIKMSDLVTQDAKVGDEIDVEVVKVNDGEGNVVLSQRNIVNRRNWDALMAQYDAGEYVDGVGKEAVKGGLIANVGGVRAFIPASQLSQRYVERIEDFVGKEMKLKIIEVDKQKKRIVASRKAVIAEEAAARKQEVWGKLIEGELINGIVRRLTDFGAFVDIGGVDGLVHVTDLSWGRVRHPSDIVSPNQEIVVKILSLDPERERIQLGYKQTQARPWDIAEEKYPVGSIVEGKVVRITTFGAFVELEPGLDGLVHISQCALTRIGKVEDAVQVGQIVRVKVLSVDPQAKRISLSIRAALEDDAFDYNQEIPGEDMYGDEGGYDEYATPVDYSQYAAVEEEPAIEEVAAVEEAPVEEAAAEETPAEEAPAAEEAAAEEAPEA